MSPANSDLRLFHPGPQGVRTRSQLRWIWNGYLARRNLTLLTSQWKAGKTTLLTHLLQQLRNGGKLFDRRVNKGKAIVISEEPASLWNDRSRTFDLSSQVWLSCRPFHHRPGPSDIAALIDQVLELHHKVGLSLVVIDPLAVFLPAVGEQGAAGVLDALRPLQRLTAANLAVLLLHHPRKKYAADGQAARGSGALGAWVDILLELHWFRHAADADRRRRLLAWSRHDATPRSLLIELSPDGAHYLVRDEPIEDPLRDARAALYRILETVTTKQTRRDILKDWPEDFPAPSGPTLWRLLESLVASGDLLRDGAGTRRDPFRYWLPWLEKLWKVDPLAQINQLAADAQREVAAFLPAPIFNQYDDDR